MRAEWHRVLAMSELRELRRAIECGQREFAALLSVPLETLRTSDSGRRPVPVDVLLRATRAVSEHAKNSEPLSLDQLARELGVHQRTLRDAARAGRLRVTFSVRSVFGRPIRLATRADSHAFMRTRYRHYGRRGALAAPLPSVPHDYAIRLVRLRHRLRLTQAQLAHRIGAANKAVIYQWESRKRTPSPVFWERIEALQGPTPDARRTRTSSRGFVAEMANSGAATVPNHSSGQGQETPEY